MSPRVLDGVGVGFVGWGGVVIDDLKIIHLENDIIGEFWWEKYKKLRNWDKVIAEIVGKPTISAIPMNYVDKWLDHIGACYL